VVITPRVIEHDDYMTNAGRCIYSLIKLIGFYFRHTYDIFNARRNWRACLSRVNCQ